MKARTDHYDSIAHLLGYTAVREGGSSTLVQIGQMRDGKALSLSLMLRRMEREREDGRTDEQRVDAFIVV